MSEFLREIRGEGVTRSILYLLVVVWRTRVIKSISRALSARSREKSAAGRVSTRGRHRFNYTQAAWCARRGEARRANPHNLRNARLRFLLP